MLTGIVPPLVTPLTRTGEVDVESIGSLVEHLVGAGVDGLFALGSSGETALLTDAMRVTAARAVIDAAAGRVPVAVGAIEMTTLRTIESASVATDLGASAVVVTAPFYTRTHRGRSPTTSAASLPRSRFRSTPTTSRWPCTPSSTTDWSWISQRTE